MQAQTQNPMLPEQTHVVMALGAHARRLSWGYAVYVIYYIGVGTLVAYFGVRRTSLGQVASDVMRLSGVLVPIFAYLLVNGLLAVALRYFVRMHTAARWALAAVAIVLALIGTLSFFWGLWDWSEAGFAPGQWKSQLLTFAAAAGYVFLAYRVARIARMLHRFALIDGIWLHRFERMGRKPI